MMKTFLFLNKYRVDLNIIFSICHAYKLYYDNENI